MKQHLFIYVLITLLTSCVQQSKLDEANAVIDSLKIENNNLKIKVDELENGEDRLIKKINLYINENKFLSANTAIQKLTKFHPESDFLVKNQKTIKDVSLKAEIEFKREEKARKDSIRKANITNLGDWKIGNYVDDFDEPTGNHYVYKRIIGEFDNSATSSDILSVVIQISKNNYTKYDKSLLTIQFEFDEYANGVEDEEFSDAENIKIINKKEKRKYIREYSFGNFYDENRNDILLENILLNEGCYDFYLKFEYQTRYRFSIDTQYLENALIKANIIEL